MVGDNPLWWEMPRSTVCESNLVVEVVDEAHCAEVVEQCACCTN